MEKEVRKGKLIRAVIFDMFETLITHYESPLYFGAEMAEDAGISKENFYPLWRGLDYERTIGKITLEELLERILKENSCYTEELLKKLVEKRIAAKEDCFKHLHSEIMTMLSELKTRGLLVGLISNCYSEEGVVIKKSELYPFFDAVYLSYEQGVAKPEKEIFLRCTEKMGVKPEECLYIGDGGSLELETARALGMQAVQAAWYLKEGTSQPVWRKEEFKQVESPLELINYLKKGNVS